MSILLRWMVLNFQIRSDKMSLRTNKKIRVLKRTNKYVHYKYIRKGVESKITKKELISDFDYCLEKGLLSVAE